MGKNKKLLLAKIFFVGGLLVGLWAIATPPQTHAAVNSILQGQICAPDNSPTGYSSNLGNCINNIYIISLSVGGVVAFIMFIIAGYMYSTGTEKSVSEAKSMIASSIAGLIILFGAYALLNTIDPDFTQIPQIVINNAALCSGANTTENCKTLVPQLNLPTPAGGGSGNGSCTPSTLSGSTPTDLGSTCFTSANANAASEVAQVESGGNPAAQADMCVDGSQPMAASFGLFQINISANSIAGLNCPSAFTASASSATSIPSTTGVATFHCAVTNMNLYNQCVAAAENPATNITAACALSNNGASWGPWQTTANKCGF